MQLRMWTYDLAREQSPALEHLRVFCDTTIAGGYNGIGLYLEHRFAYPSSPWAHGKGCLTPEVIEQLQREYPQLQIIPFVNLLGHFEGMIYTEHGKRFREERFAGMQACPSCPEFLDLARGIIDDTLSTFTSQIVHIGGDETQQLGKCPRCAARVVEAESQSVLGSHVDGKAVLYGEHFGPLARYVIEKGRRPAVWGDMYLEHPTALDYMPKETLIFDWQYFHSPLDTSRSFKERGFEVVCCPTLQTYNASWFHIEQSEENVRQAVEAAIELDAFGVCVTTWECALFGNYETLLPAIRASGDLLAGESQPAVPTPASRFGGNDVGPNAPQIQFEPNDQLAPDDVTSSDMSLVEAIADNIVMNMLRDQVSYALSFVGDDLHIRDSSGQDAGKIPEPQAYGAIRRLTLLANVDPFRQGSDTIGEIHGTWGDQAFALHVVFIGNMRRPEVRITNPDEAGTASTASRIGSAMMDAYQAQSAGHREWAQLMGVDLQTAGGIFTPTGIRSSLKVRLLLQANPFLAWLHHHEELTGEVGDKALAILDHAISIAPDSSCRGVSEFVRGAIEFVRYADQSRQAYANGLPGVATSALAPCRQIFDNMERTARANHLKIGGSLADIERCRIAREHVERVMKRIKEFGDGSLGYLPAYEHISHPKFIPHDQAAWWLINRWANE